MPAWPPREPASGSQELDAAAHLAAAQAAAEADRPDLIRQHVRAGLAVVADEETELRLRLTGTASTVQDAGPRAALAEIAELAERAASYPQVVALCSSQVAAHLLQSGDLAAAADQLAAIQDELLGPRDRIRVLLNRGTLAAHLEPGAGEADLWAAHAVSVEEQMPETQFRALHNLGWSAFLRGDLPEAMTLMQRADRLDADVDRTVARLDLARVQLEAGLVAEARALLTAAAQGAAAAGQQHTAGEVELELARTHQLLREQDLAVAACGRARRRFEDLGSAAWRDRARLREIAAAVPSRWSSVGEDPRLLLGELTRLAAAAREQGDGAGWVTGTLARARLAVDRGAAAEAERALAELGDIARGRAAFLATRLAVLEVRARLALAAGARRRVSRALDRASRDLAEARTRPASLDLRTAIGVHARDLAELDLELAAASHRPGSLLAASERWRPAGDELPAVRPPADPAVADLVRTLRSLREDVRTAPPGVDTAPLLDRARRIESQVRALDWTARPDGPTGQPDPRRRVPPSEPGVVLGDRGRALISYVQLGTRLTAVTLAPGGGAVRVELGPVAALVELLARVRADVAALATTRIPGPLLASVHDSLVGELEELGAGLVAPVLAVLPPEAPLVVVPAGVLGNVPWGMLPGTRGRPMVVSRSARAWAAATAAAQERPPPAVGLGAMAGPGLTRAPEEVASIAELHLDARVVGVEDSSAAALAHLLAACGTVHIAAHGVHDHANPLFSHVRTAEGPAFAHEFLHDRVSARHVVIAACEGGRASFRPGEEPLGFAATLLSRGVSTVVAPTILVPDDDAHDLVMAHHRLVAGGLDPVHALARATVEAPLLAGSFTAFGVG